MIEHAVVIAGGGPSGMMLAAELALAGVDAAIVERRTSKELIGSRAGGLHARTIEVLDQHGIAQRFLAAGQAVQVASFGGISLDISDFPTRHNYGLALWQNRFEDLLADWVEELGAPIYRGREVTGYIEHEEFIEVTLGDGEMVRGRYLVGCDGGRSLIRKAAGIDFPGWEATTSSLIAEVEVRDEPEWGLHRDAKGVHGLSRMEDGVRVRVVVREEDPGRRDEPTLRDLSDALIAVRGTDYGVHSPTWLSRFSDATRQAARYRKGRVLLAGDAAHIHYPVGGQGLGLGVQDAVNLGWKLAQVVKGISPESLLDTYQAERYPVTARVLRTTMAASVLTRSDDRIEALREVMVDVLHMEEPRKVYAGRMSGLDIHYDLGEGHPLLGRRMPDLDVVAASGPLRVFTLLHRARPLLLNFGEAGALQIAPWANRVEIVDAEYSGAWELPVLGTVLAPMAVLVRPDGYVAWVGMGNDVGLEEALVKWFGAPDAP